MEDVTTAEDTHATIEPITDLNITSVDTNTVSPGGVENTLTWTDSPNATSGYYVYRTEDPNTINEYDYYYVGWGTQTYTDTNPVPGQHYYYLVRAFLGYNTPVDTMEDVTTATDQEVAQVTPITDFAVVNNDFTLDFTWTPAVDASSIRILYKESLDQNPSAWRELPINLLDPTSSSTFSYNNYLFIPMISYDFKLEVDGGLNAGDSNIVSVIPNLYATP